MSALHGPLENVVPSYRIILRNIQKDFVGVVYGNTKEETTQTIASSQQRPETSETSTCRDPLRVEFDRPLHR